MRNFSDKICGDNQNIFYVQKLLFENRAVYEIMGKYIVEPDWPQMTTCRICIACWIFTAAGKNSEYVTLLLFHCKNGCTKMPHCCVIRTLPVLFGFIVDFLFRWVSLCVVVVLSEEEEMSYKNIISNVHFLFFCCWV
jgi:hypothetical protein